MKSTKEEALEMIYLFEAIQAANSDDKKKEIGDRVVVWDGSGNIDKNTKVKRWGIDKLFKSEAIVIAINQSIYTQRNEIQIKMGLESYLLDLLIVFPTGEEVYTASQFVRIVN